MINRSRPVLNKRQQLRFVERSQLLPCVVWARSQNRLQLSPTASAKFNDGFSYFRTSLQSNRKPSNFHQKNCLVLDHHIPQKLRNCIMFDIFFREEALAKITLY